jgi:cyclophilin family peptidyl-prolyl cis-trans isomerase
VELALNFPNDNLKQSWFVVLELAPLDEMPHSVYTFLEQVSRGLFNDGGYSFHHIGSHVIQGGPFANRLTDPDMGMSPSERFAKSGLAHVLFQEYSHQFPHEHYSLGFAHRPSGPSIYINLKNNTQLHGPGGYSADGHGDPCFAKVVKGHDVIDMMLKGPFTNDEDKWKELAENIAVRWIHIMQ